MCFSAGQTNKIFTRTSHALSRDSSINKCHENLFDLTTVFWWRCEWMLLCRCNFFPIICAFIHSFIYSLKCECVDLFVSAFFSVFVSGGERETTSLFLLHEQKTIWSNEFGENSERSVHSVSSIEIKYNKSEKRLFTFIHISWAMLVRKSIQSLVHSFQ